MTPVTSMTGLAATLAAHPLLPSAWVQQKLCYYANSEACQTTDPEFERIVGVFKSSGYSWNALIRTIFASPLLTYAAPTSTAEQTREVVAVSRRDNLCAALNDRLGLTDVCALDALSEVSAKTTLPVIVSGLPSDGYGRDAVAPVLPNQPTALFPRRHGDASAKPSRRSSSTPHTPRRALKQWSSSSPPGAAIADFVDTLAGADAERPPIRAGPGRCNRNTTPP